MSLCSTKMSLCPTKMSLCPTKCPYVRQNMSLCPTKYRVRRSHLNNYSIRFYTMIVQIWTPHRVCPNVRQMSLCLTTYRRRATKAEGRQVASTNKKILVDYFHTVRNFHGMLSIPHNISEITTSKEVWKFLSSIIKTTKKSLVIQLPKHCVSKWW